jgi:hypothetical protein
MLRRDPDRSESPEENVDQGPIEKIAELLWAFAQYVEITEINGADPIEVHRFLAACKK